jgi:hypothetical protein
MSRFKDIEVPAESFIKIDAPPGMGTRKLSELWSQP